MLLRTEQMAYQDASRNLDNLSISFAMWEGDTVVRVEWKRRRFGEELINFYRPWL